MVNKHSRSIGSRGATYSYQETEEYKLKPWQLRQMPIYRAVLVEEHALSPQKAVIEVLRAAVADKTVTSEQAAARLVSLLRADSPASRKIEIRQTAKASLEARDYISGKIRPFLKNDPDQAEQQRKVNKRVFNNAPRQRV